MILKELAAENYRNLSDLKINACENINVIYGENAQGKTNIIEAIWLFTGNKSFRGANIQELIMFEKEKSSISINFADSKRTQNAIIKLAPKKKIILNSVELKGQAELNGEFLSVVFSPTHLSLVKDGPKNRRKFIDIAISQIKPQYKSYLHSYEKLIDQRNALLRLNSRYCNLKNDIDVWDIQIAKIGTIISIYRNDYIKKLSQIVENIYCGISSDKEKLQINYNSTVFKNIDEQALKIYDEEKVEVYYNALKEAFENDVKRGSSSVGVHRDDLDIFTNSHSTRLYGSQGQQRSAIIALKMGEAELLKKVTGEKPIMLLDDVMSELDEKRQDYILNHVKDMQVFITCCDFINTLRLQQGRLFKIENGMIKKVSDYKKDWSK